MPSSPSISEGVVAQTDSAPLKHDKINETLERLQSKSTDLAQLSLQWKDLESRFDSIKRSIGDQTDDLNRKELRLEWKSKFVKQRCKEIESREKALEAEKKVLDDRCVEIDQTYQLVSMSHAQAEETARGWEEKMRRLKAKEKSLDSKMRKAERKENRLVLKRRVMKRQFKLLKKLSDELIDKQEGLDERASELNLREKKLNSVERGLLERVLELEPKEKRLGDMESELKRREASFRARYKVFITNERCLNTVIAKLRGEEVLDADIRFYITMNGRDLLGYLTSHVDDLDRMRDEVTRALKLSSNPAMLVLDAMQGFYGGSSEGIFDLSVVRRCCVVLLEQLTELEPQIGVRERERARLLALEWKASVKPDVDQDLEVLGFLQLVCTYRLTNWFDKDELAKSIETVARHVHAPALCRGLGIADKAHDIVLHLIQDMHAVEAVRFIHEFNLMDTLPPAPILRNYLESVVSAADNISTQDFTKEQATDMVVTALITVIKCIKESKLDSEYPTETLEEQVLELQRQRNCFPSDSTSEEHHSSSITN